MTPHDRAALLWEFLDGLLAGSERLADVTIDALVVFTARLDALDARITALDERLTAIEHARRREARP